MYLSNLTSFDFPIGDQANHNQTTVESMGTAEIGGLIGGIIGLFAALTGVLILVRKNLELIHRVLNSISNILTQITPPARTNAETDAPPPPPRRGVLWNCTDDERARGQTDRPTDNTYDTANFTTISQRPYSVTGAVWM